LLIADAPSAPAERDIPPGAEIAAGSLPTSGCGSSSAVATDRKLTPFFLCRRVERDPMTVFAKFSSIPIPLSSRSSRRRADPQRRLRRQN